MCLLVLMMVEDGPRADGLRLYPTIEVVLEDDVNLVVRRRIGW